MAAPTKIEDFVGLILHLPHVFWGTKDAKKFYPDDWKTGSRQVTLKDYQPASQTANASLGFTAEDSDEYRIGLEHLQTYWEEKRFQQQRMHIFQLFVSLVCCFRVIFLLSVHIKISGDQSDNTGQKKTKNKRKANKQSK